MRTSATSTRTREPDGAFVQIDGESYYRIGHSNRMAPFLVSLVSDTDLWMFVTSTGGLTAGRSDPDGSLFPYDNVDRLYDAHHVTGPITLLRVRRGGEDVIWEPFTARIAQGAHIERHIYKSVVGDRIVFEEIDHELGLAFRYSWGGCDAFGFVREARLTRISGGSVEVDVLDGLRNLLPYGASLALYQQQSSLVDAYKRNECDPATGLAIFSLSAKIIDRAEAAEELRANVAWCHGLERPVISVSDGALEAFRAGEPVVADMLTTGKRGHFLVHSTQRLAAGGSAAWRVIVDAKLGPVEVVRLRERLRAGEITSSHIDSALATATQALTRNVGTADGLQITARASDTAHHFASVLFNNLRGGVFVNGYLAPRADIADFLRTRNRSVAERHADFIAGQSEETDVLGLLEAARGTGDPDLERLCLEYLPLSFGRRHGDPSRPWNRFSIRVRNSDGTPALYYEGNWRDVFQNWEALAMSFPGYLPGMIAKFVNASTLDGFNPYRITRNGVEWEVVDPEDPWAYIGYWGDHQIVYSLRLLEALRAYSPGTLLEMLDRRVFSYANVPYRIKPYADIRRDPHSTIVFDAALDAEIAERVRTSGTDARLVADSSGGVRHANLIEKLIVSALARLSNLVPDGGIWMNTQRPEWNDANNALAGYGVSTVTLAHLRRYLSTLAELLRERGAAPAELAADVATWMREIHAVLERYRPTPGAPAQGDRTRKQIVDALGESFGRYRERAYALTSVQQSKIPAAELVSLLETALAHVEHSLAYARRDDGLFHSYHVLGAGTDDSLPLTPLTMMLEGQVAALSSGAMSAGEAADLVDALFDSPMFDEARRSFLLYPERELPSFTDKNDFPAQRARAIALLNDLIERGDTSIVALDPTGRCRFHPDLSQARILAVRLDALASQADWTERVERDRAAVLEVFEAVFHHRSFTGRSGTMYGFEGIGCIYWHMVAKLLLAVQEQALRALQDGDDAAPRLVEAYYRVRSGLGHEKSPAEFGAFPMDPYSHTPKGAGARQPGMTGQVKEEIITRLGELGVRVAEGRVLFRPTLLRRSEFLAEPAVLRGFDAEGLATDIDVPARALAFTFCQVPVVYHMVQGEPWLRVTGRDGKSVERKGDQLDTESSRALFERRGDIRSIEVGVPKSSLLVR